MAGTKTPTPETKAARQRFTILDALLLFPAYAFAAALTKPLCLHSNASFVAYVISVMIAATVGSVFAGPIILLGADHFPRFQENR
jgi:predicted TIM-barrel fold metal-dependent hydrolase